jgi:hypothetical protein
MTLRPHRISHRHAERVSASIVPHNPKLSVDKWPLKQVQGDGVWK